MATDETDKLKTTATLGGFPLLASSSIRWRLAEGVNPVIETYDMIPADATALLAVAAKGVTTTLEMGSNADKVTVRGLYVLRASPSQNPFITRVTVADRRYWWNYSHALRRFNIRRKVGTKRVGQWGNPILEQSIADFAFSPYSTKSGDDGDSKIAGLPSDRWTAEAATRNVLKHIADFEKKNYGNSFSVLTVGQPFKTEQWIEDLSTDDNSRASLARVIKAVPTAGLFVNLDGQVVIFDKTNNAENTMVAALGNEMVSGGHIRSVDNSLVRPREIHVLFTREIEVRFDYAENTDNGSRALGTPSGRWMENVLPIPDYQLTVRRVNQPMGTWITIDDARDAFGAPPITGVTSLTHAFIQTAMVPFVDMWGPMGITGALDPNAEWAGRIRAIQNNYRQTYRINRRWMDRIFSLKAMSVGTVDQATGQRGTARAYADHAYIPAKKYLFRQVGEIIAAGRSSGDLSLAVNVDGYVDKIGPTSRTAPATISILDEDQGIVHVGYQVDPIRMQEMVLPSKVLAATMPTADITNREQPISFDSMAGSRRPPTLSPEHKIAIVLTAIPASPNNNEQLERVIVKPEQVVNLLHHNARSGLRNARGPVMEIRVTHETARIPWFDDKAEETMRAFGLRPGTPNFSDVLMNKGGSPGIASLDAIALSEAASVYASLVDRLEGSADGKMNASISPAGWLAEVSFVIETSGVGKTVVNLPEQIPALTLWNYLDKGTRAILMRSVERAA